MLLGFSPVLSVFWATMLAIIVSSLRSDTAIVPLWVVFPLLVCLGNVVLVWSGCRPARSSPSTRPILVFVPLTAVAVLSASPRQELAPVAQRLRAGHEGGHHRRAQRRRHLRDRRHHRRRGDADRTGAALRRHHHRLRAGQPAAHHHFHRRHRVDRRPRRAGHRLLHHVRGDRRAGADQARRARLRGAHVHLLLRGAVGGFSADGAVAVRGRGHHRRQSVSDHAAVVEVHDAGLPGAVRVRARPAGHRPAAGRPRKAAAGSISSRSCWRRAPASPSWRWPPRAGS